MVVHSGSKSEVPSDEVFYEQYYHVFNDASDIIADSLILQCSSRDQSFSVVVISAVSTSPRDRKSVPVVIYSIASSAINQSPQMLWHCPAVNLSSTVVISLI